MLAMVSCHDDIRVVQNIDAPDMTGEPVAFASGLRTVKSGTRAYFGNETDMNTELGKFHPVVETYNDSTYLYTFDISMYRKKDGAFMGSGTYQLKSIDESSYDDKGTLEVKFASSQLYWPDNSNQYGFKVDAGNKVLTNDQHNATLFLDNDLLLGYGFEPLWDNDNHQSSDDIDALNYRTSREWYAANKEAIPTGSDADWRKIPLYLKHQRCWVTIVLKAGKGVQREILTYDATNENFTSKMFSYGESGDIEILPWRRAGQIEYDEDKNGPAVTLTELQNSGETNTITLNAIVDPHNYLEAIDAPISQFVLNDSKYEFMPQNDSHYAAWNEGRNASQAEKDAWTTDYRNAFDAAAEAMQAYNLTAGKHLTITATLTTDRIVLITALLEDWEDLSMSSICDDFGQQGDPFEIDSREKLLEFLNNKNKPGNIGLVSAPEINLDVKADGTEEEWIPRNLNCMLNLAGAKLITKERVFDNINSGASLLNGEIEMAGSTPVYAAVCNNNMGSIEQINVPVKDDVRQNVYATKGGMVGVNYGTIYNCVCDLQVKGTEGYIGGIAGESKKHETLNIQPVIDQCVMNGKVDGSDGITGAGGIVGYAENIVSRSTFNYGMTLLQQNNAKFKNIVAATYTSDDDDDLTVIAYGNSWPTTVDNTIGKHSTHNSNNNSSARYQAVIDSQAELYELLVNTSHGTGARYRIADDFSVDNTWTLGVGDTGDYSSNEPKYNLDFELDGNDKTITTHGKRLFSHINGYFHDMIIYCAESIIATSFEDGTDMISSFAYSVNQRADGDRATIENIRMKMAPNTYIQAANPAGLICRAYGGAQIIDCEVLVDLRVKFKSGYDNHESYRFAGGIAAVAVDATFTGCKVHTGTKILQDADLSFNRQAQYRGGIVGGIVTESGYIPGTVIEDCISWWDYGTLNSGDSPAGAIIGSTQYIDVTSSLQQGLLPGNGGNWWSDQLRPAADISGDDVTLLLGRRNNVVPTEEINY